MNFMTGEGRPMKLGVTFPQTEIGQDPAAIREYAQTAEELGYSHLIAFDHVLGANPAGHDGWKGPYDFRHLFHEPLVLFGYLAAVTSRLELVTAVVILPQRQTALVAKQTAEIDVLSNGRLRFGVGIGWNHVEYEGLGETFWDRGQRCEEQIEVLRALWTQETVNFEGHWHKITSAGINPLPIQRPIPIWIGGTHDRVIRRIARAADGWFPQFQPGVEAQLALQKLRDYASAEGRDPSGIGVEGRVNIANKNESEWEQAYTDWKQMGASHLAVNTMGAGLTTPQEHIRQIVRFKQVIDSM